ncbi:MAG: T9SS type A sorting domain-containing protein [Chitinophagales bacterium]|nr:T9SS type A sorting domain-containing protein [Bacteroidota bacterium]MCB9043709.1 T9SS type A sorting domain-containing protein [Chitinophagales bacterium]
MKNFFILKAVFACLCCFGFSHVFAQTDCNADAGQPTPPTEEHFCNDGTNLQAMAVDLSFTANTNTTDYIFIITEKETGYIKGATHNGIFDFSKDSLNMPFPQGEYCFTGVAYSKEELDVVTNNVLVNTYYLSCLDGGEDFPEIIDCFYKSGVSENPPTIELVFDNVLDSILPQIGINVCLDIVDDAYVYCLKVDCEVGIDDAFTEMLDGSVFYDNQRIYFSTVPSFTPFDINIYNIQGQNVWQNKEATFPMQIDANNWQNGVYVVQITQNNLTYAKNIYIAR